MSNGNTLKDIQKVLEDHPELEDGVSRGLIMAGIIHNSDRMDKFEKRIKKIEDKAWMINLALALGAIGLPMFVGLLWQLFTGQAVIVFGP